MIKEHKPKVSVCVVTYNHEKYIRECLQSIVNQKTDFDFEVIVGDDFSTDGTREIVKDFAERYPGIVKPLLHDKNLGGTGTGNYIIVNKAASGEYISYVDGDDLMLPDKLQIMVDCLQKSENATAAVHQLRVINKDGSFAGWIWPQYAPGTIDIGYMLMHHPVFGHSSLIFRKGLIDWETIEKVDFIDFYIYLLISLKGPIVFVDRILGCYRASVGISKSFIKFLPYIEFVFCEAEKLGVPRKIVSRARAYHLYKTSLNYLLVEYSSEKFCNYIEMSFQQAIIGITQCILFVFRNYPKMLYFLHRQYKYLKNHGFKRWLPKVEQ